MDLPLGAGDSFTFLAFITYPSTSSEIRAHLHPIISLRGNTKRSTTMPKKRPRDECDATRQIDATERRQATTSLPGTVRRSEARQSNELVVRRSCLEARVGVRDNDDESVPEKLASWVSHSLTPEFQRGLMVARYDNLSHGQQITEHLP